MVGRYRYFALILNLLFFYSPLLGSSWHELEGSATGGGISQTGCDKSAGNFILQLDFLPDGNPVVCWSDNLAGNDKLYIRSFDGSNWNEVGIGSASGEGIATSPGTFRASPFSLAVASNGYIFESGAGGQACQTKMWDLNIWNDAAGGCPGTGDLYEPHLTINDFGQVFLSLTNEYTVRCYELSEGLWNPLGGVDGIVENGVGQMHNGICTAVDGSPVVAYAYRTANTPIKVEKWNGSSWEIVGSSFQSSSPEVNPYIVNDGNDHYYVYWRRYVDGIDALLTTSVYAMYWNGSTWEELDGSASGDGVSGPFSRWPIGCYVPGKGFCLVWVNQDSATGGIIKGKCWNGSTWEELTPGSMGESGIAQEAKAPALKADPAGNLYLSWYHHHDGVWDIYVLKSFGELQLNQTLIYDSISRLTTAYHDLGRYTKYEYDKAHNRKSKIQTSQLIVSQGSSNPGSYDIANNNTDVALLQLELSADEQENVFISSLNLALSGTVDESTAISAFNLYHDVDNSGSKTGSDVLLSTTVAPLDDSDIQFYLTSPFSISASQSERLLVTTDLSDTGSVGQTLEVSFEADEDVKAKGETSGKSILPFGAPIQSSVITITSSPDTIPPTFAGLNAIPAGGTEAHLDWPSATDPSLPITYLVYQSTNSGFDPTGTTPDYVTTSTSLDISDLVLGQTYYFIVRPQDTAGNVDENLVRQTFTPVDTEPPVFAGLESVEADSYTTGTIHLNYSSATDESTPIEYDIWYAANTNPDPSGPPQVTTSSTNHTFFGLTLGNSYCFLVRARDAVGNRDTNSEYHCVALNAPPYPPDSPSPGNGTDQTDPLLALTLSPGIDSDGTVIAHRIEVWRQEIDEVSGDPIIIESRTGFSDGTSATFQPLVDEPFLVGETYYWKAQAFDNEGAVSPFSSTFSFTMIEPTTAVEDWMNLEAGK